LLILGIGPLVGNFLGPHLGTYFSHKASDGTDVVNFSQMFLIPSGTALIAAIILVLFFHPPAKAVAAEGKAAPAH